MRFRVFDLDDLHQLDVVVSSAKERDEIIASHRETYPDAKVYWTGVHEA